MYLSNVKYFGSSDLGLRNGYIIMLCRHGVTHTLDQVFNAPLLIKKIMNDESGITRAFIGTEYGPVSASHTSCS